MFSKQNIDLQKVAKGNRKAQKILFQQYYAYVMSVALRYMRNREEAEEILNDTFYKVFKNIKKYDNKQPLKPWIRKIVVNSCLDKLRSLKNKPVYQDFPEVDVADEEIELKLESTEQLLPILRLLPPKYRVVFNLYVFEDYKHHEIATKLGISEGTSKSNYSRAKQFLIQKLGKEKEAFKEQMKTE